MDHIQNSSSLHYKVCGVNNGTHNKTGCGAMKEIGIYISRVQCGVLSLEGSAIHIPFIIGGQQIVIVYLIVGTMMPFRFVVIQGSNCIPKKVKKIKSSKVWM